LVGLSGDKDKVDFQNAWDRVPTIAEKPLPCNLDQNFGETFGDWDLRRQPLLFS
jgi:hypothetical protein